jgi:hypothetical protein
MRETALNFTLSLILSFLLSLCLINMCGCNKNGEPTVHLPNIEAKYENLTLPIQVYFEGLPSPVVESINVAIGWWQQFLAASPLCENRQAFKLCREALFELTSDEERAFITITENFALPVNIRSITRLERSEDGEVTGCRISLGPDWSQSALQGSMGTCVGLSTGEISAAAKE